MVSANEVGEFLDILANRMPKFFGSLREVLFSEEAGASLGAAVGSFYKALIESGFPEEKAFELARAYMRTYTDIGNLMNSNVQTVQTEG